MNKQQSIEIIYADESCIVVNKPSGLLSIPDGYEPSTPFLGAILARGFGKVWIVHRLDRESSGVMVVARTVFAHREINLQFEHRQIQKTYHALIIGVPDWESIDVDIPLRVNGDRKHRTVPSQLTGKPAKTHFSIIKRYANGCLVEARPQTGYTHQIRAHLSFLGFPILGDTLYRRPQHPQYPSGIPVPSSSRTFLHAREISFSHPKTKKVVNFIAQYPEDFIQAIHDIAH